MDQLLELPMLYFDLKHSSGTVDFKTSFQKRILEIYSQDASNFISEIQEFEVLRSNAVRVTHDINGCMLLKRYYAQLSIVNNKFHYSSRSCDLKFTWVDTTTKANVTGDIQLELDSILHNIGALHSELGAFGRRTTSESIKVACTHFQCAAWVFKKLKENTHFKSRDLSQDLMAFTYHIMLAQAQECFLEKSILDKRNPSIVAKIAAEVYSNYDYLIVILVAAELQEKDCLYNKLFKEWRKFFEFKISFYSAICAYFMGLHEETKMGERVAWLMSAEDKLKASVKLAKATSRASLVGSVDYLTDLVKKALAQAKQNNDFIYHDIVPTQDKLTAIKGVSLVKEIPFSISDAEVMGKDIFARLVPIEAYETVSIYSDSRDQMWRDIKLKIDDKNEELVKFLSIIQLDKENIRERKFNVPERLASICATLNSSSNNFLDEVKERLSKLDELSKEVDDQFKELEKQINSEEEFERSTKSNVSTSLIDLKGEFDRNFEVHKSAMASNKGLHDVIKTHEKDIELLMNSSVQDLERLFSMSAEDLPTDKDNLAELDKLFDKIEEMKKQRAFLENKLKQSIKNDDILKSVVAHSESEIKAVFEKENQKFSVDQKYLEQNLSAQDTILNALTRANADYAVTRKAFIKVERLRNEKIESLYESYENVQGVLINLDKGIEFYANLKKVIQQLKLKISKHIEERKLNQNTENRSSVTLESSLQKNLTDSKTISNNPSFEETKKGPSKLKDFLPAYYDAKSSRLSNITMPTNMATNVSSNIPTNLPNQLSNVPNLSNQQPISNYSNMSLSALPPSSPHVMPSQPSFPTNQNHMISSKPLVYQTPTNFPPSTNMFNATPQISTPYTTNYGTSNQTSTYPTPNINPANSTAGYNVMNPYTNYTPANLPQQHPILPGASAYQSNSHVPSLNSYQQPNSGYSNENYYMPSILPAHQYLPAGTNYYSTATNQLHHPMTTGQQPTIQPANAAQNLNYGMQNLNLNNGTYPTTQSYYNYIQPAIHPAAPSQPKIPVDSLLNSDNNLSEEIQPILKPTSIVSQPSVENEKSEK